MQVSSSRPHMLTSNQRGRGNDPVVVLGRIRSAVAVNIGSSNAAFYYCASRVESTGSNTLRRRLGSCRHSEVKDLGGRHCASPVSFLVFVLHIHAGCFFQLAGRIILLHSQQKTLKLCHGSRETMCCHKCIRLKL